MSSIDQYTKQAQNAQDVELTQAIYTLKQNPQALQKFLQNAQDSLFKDVTTQKNDTITKVYGDFQNAAQSKNAVVSYYLRDKELKSAQDSLFKDKAYDASSTVNDKNLAQRQYEINQWAFGNKMDTLFVYQQLFIILCTVVILTFLQSRAMLSSTVYYILMTVLVVIFIVTLVYRYRFTVAIRDQRYWNRRVFPDGEAVPQQQQCTGGTTGSGSSSGGLWADLTADASSAYSTADTDISSGISTAETDASSAYQSASADVSSAYQTATADVSSAYQTASTDASNAYQTAQQNVSSAYSSL